jgi:hypothetical protein
VFYFIINKIVRFCCKKVSFFEPRGHALDPGEDPDVVKNRFDPVKIGAVVAS